MAYAREVLGSLEDPFSSDFNADAWDDDASAYVQWRDAVLAAGGTPSVYPGRNLTITRSPSVAALLPWNFDWDAAKGRDVNAQGLPAAKYPRAVIHPGNLPPLNPLFSREPDMWTDDDRFGFYLAPEAVWPYAVAGGLTHWQPGDPTPSPTWYGDYQSLLKLGGLAIGGLLLAQVLNLFPRRRD